MTNPPTAYSLQFRGPYEEWPDLEAEEWEAEEALSP